MTVEDPEGRLLHGAPAAVGAHAIPGDARRASARVGAGTPPARTRSRTLLEHLVAREAERKALGAEVLHLYREINLIYSFSEKLAATARPRARRASSPCRKRVI